ncbi:hypothetical protein HPB52_025040 [Rhipicephalus sanguineus]|uniref:THAP-type domain-containing protein n=1 Tax=Rhipicephalus sanguineus TaxID=34632 RepID=A0A9D4TDK1_RHISA|nr:hypothetical protein HPB52_025040 [Rhipicephalus sanguineus]
MPGCASGYRKDASSSDRHFFYAPTDVSLRAAWNKAVPRAGKELTATSRVCDLHFHQQDILKTQMESRKRRRTQGVSEPARVAVEATGEKTQAKVQKREASSAKVRHAITSSSRKTFQLKTLRN